MSDAPRPKPFEPSHHGGMPRLGSDPAAHIKARNDSRENETKKIGFGKVQSCPDLVSVHFRDNLVPFGVFKTLKNTEGMKTWKLKAYTIFFLQCFFAKSPALWREARRVS
jgi:hypothetical protein